MRNLGRTLLWGMVCSLVAAAIVATASGCGLKHPVKSSGIYVTGMDELPYERFYYKINNMNSASNGAQYEFTLSTSQTEFFAGLCRSYQVFDQSDDSLQLIYQGQIYAVRRYADGLYALYREDFRFTDEGGEPRHFPFPTAKMPGGDQYPPNPRVEGTEFHTTADMPYLVRFYQVYGDAVKVDGNTITFAGCTITVEPGGLVKVASPPPTTVHWYPHAEVTQVVTALVRGEMEAGLSRDVTLDTLELNATSVAGATWVFEGVARAHWTADGGPLTYYVTATYIQGVGLSSFGWSDKKE
jgi:hypothetical protein